MFRPDPKPEKKEKVRGFSSIRRTKEEKPLGSIKKSVGIAIHAKNKPTGESFVFKEIWDTRPHVSSLSGRPIEYPRPENFVHLLAKGKGKYPKFKLNPKNIQLGTAYEHFLYDDGTIDLRAKYAEQCLSDGYTCDWSKWFTLREQLKKEYPC